jgi:hypothetical protein
VIARNSSFTYKGKAVDVRQVGRDLGVRYALEGSVRRGGSRMRITGQLVDATSGAQIWSDRFEGDLSDVFDLQDRITESVVGALVPTLHLAAIARLKQKPESNLDAYDLYLRALQLEYQFTEESLAEAIRCLVRAVEIDPPSLPPLRSRIGPAGNVAVGGEEARGPIGAGGKSEAHMVGVEGQGARAADWGRLSLGDELIVVRLTRSQAVGVDFDGEVALRAGHAGMAADHTAHVRVGRDVALDGNCPMMPGGNARPQHNAVMERVAARHAVPEHVAGLKIGWTWRPRFRHVVAKVTGRKRRRGGADDRSGQRHLKKLSALDRHPPSPP